MGRLAQPCLDGEQYRQWYFALRLPNPSRLSMFCVTRTRAPTAMLIVSGTQVILDVVLFAGWRPFSTVQSSEDKLLGYAELAAVYWIAHFAYVSALPRSSAR